MQPKVPKYVKTCNPNRQEISFGRKSVHLVRYSSGPLLQPLPSKRPDNPSEPSIPLGGSSYLTMAILPQTSRRVAMKNLARRCFIRRELIRAPPTNVNLGETRSPLEVTVSRVRSGILNHGEVTLGIVPSAISELVIQSIQCPVGDTGWAEERGDEREIVRTNANRQPGQSASIGLLKRHLRIGRIYPAVESTNSRAGFLDSWQSRKALPFMIMAFESGVSSRARSAASSPRRGESGGPVNGPPRIL